MKEEKKILKVSVGISALNEERNIGKVLEDILSQEGSGWVLSEVLVYCDGCSDKTYEVVTSINNKLLRSKLPHYFEQSSKKFVHSSHSSPVYTGVSGSLNKKIKAFNFKTRKGKVYRVNQILRKFSAEALVIFDADIRLKNSSVINNLISELRGKKGVMLVGGNSQTYPPRSFFQKAIYTSYQVYYKSRETINGGHNVFGCTGACLALRREFAKKVYIPPEVVSEDTYFYFSCLKMGYKFRHAKDAVIYFRLAGNLKDFLKQIFRTYPESVDLVYTPYFGDLIKKEYERPLGFYLKSIFEVMSRNPLGAAYMIILKLLCKPLFPIFSRRYKLEWFTAFSTK